MDGSMSIHKDEGLSRAILCINFIVRIGFRVSSCFVVFPIVYSLNPCYVNVLTPASETIGKFLSGQASI